MTELSLIIVSFNTKDYLAKTLQSVQRALQKNWEVIVVDNGSTDGSVEYVQKNAGFARLIQNKENIGFAAANNLALRVVKSPYAMLLNSDTEIPNGQSLGVLVEYLKKHPKVGMVTPKLVLENGKLDMACHRGFPTPWNALMYFLGFEKLFGKVFGLNRIFGGYHQTWKGLNTTHEIDACSGAAMVIQTSAMQRVGLLDESFFMYGEDLDWCYRFRKDGWKIVYNPDVTIVHYKNKSGIQKRVEQHHDHSVKKQSRAHFFDTMEKFYHKHHAHRYPKWFARCITIGVYIIQKVKGVFYDR